jgi:hypothetical protein
MSVQPARGLLRSFADRLSKIPQKLLAGASQGLLFRIRTASWRGSMDFSPRQIAADRPQRHL